MIPPIDLPTGTVTFLFSDIEGSTRLVQRFGDEFPALLEQHHAIMRSAFGDHDGVVVGTEGDSFFVVFRSAPNALRGAIQAQVALEDHPWPQDGRIRARMGLHCGEGRLGGDSYVGLDVNRTARIAAAGHGGQMLVSGAAARLIEGDLPPGGSLQDLGEHRLKDLLQPERIFQVTVPELRADFPPLSTLTVQPNNLPTQASEFVGRDGELEATRELLDDPAVRLLTLIGPGGIGKTRLALQIAAEHAGSAEGVSFVDLSAVRDASAAFELVARAIGAEAVDDRSPLEMVCAFLATRRSLLVLDNLEQVMEAAAGIAQLLQAAPDVRILVTTREALRVRGERLFPVPPLSLPDPGRMSAADLLRSEAGRLFVDRARDVRPDLTVSDEDAPVIAQICERLDGLPLAIELAAARVALFSPTELRDRLRDDADVLGAGTRDLPERQQTLRSTIGWSERLLDEDERTIFRVFSVFSGARIDAVEAVAGRVESLDGSNAVDALLSLVNKSLLTSRDDGGSRRLSMLETIRDYAGERLDEQRALCDAARLAHGEYFADLAEERRERLAGPERSVALAELEADLGNLRSAWSYWLEGGRLDRLDAMLDALWALHDDRGWYHGALGLTNDLLEALSKTPTTPKRTAAEILLRTSLARGLMAIRGYTPEVEAMFTAALAELDDAGEPVEAIPILRSLAAFHLYRGEFDKGLVVGRRLLELAERQDDAALEAEGHLRVGTNLVSLGAVDQGLEHLDRAIVLFDPKQQGSGRLRLGPSPGVVPLTTSAFVLWSTGHLERAIERGDEALAMAEELAHPFSTAYALFHVAFLDLWARDWVSVHERASEVRRIAEEHDYQVWRALALIFLGVSTAALGDPQEGLALSDRGIDAYRDLTTPPVFWPLLTSVRARGLAMAGKPEVALEPMDEMIELMRGRDNVLFPQLLLVKGDLLAQLTRHDDAVLAFRGAFDAAEAAMARTWQLRAATRLVELYVANGENPDGERAVLRSVYDTFTEGTDMPDLVDARAALA